MAAGSAREIVEFVKEVITPRAFFLFILVIGALLMSQSLVEGYIDAAPHTMHPKELIKKEIGFSCGPDLGKQYLIMSNTYFSQMKLDALRRWQEQKQFDADAIEE